MGRDRDEPPKMIGRRGYNFAGDISGLTITETYEFLTRTAAYIQKSDPNATDFKLDAGTENDYDGPVGYVRWNYQSLETPDEVERRVRSDRERVIFQTRRDKEEYERLKKQFG